MNLCTYCKQAHDKLHAHVMNNEARAICPPCLDARGEIVARAANDLTPELERMLSVPA